MIISLGTLVDNCEGLTTLLRSQILYLCLLFLRRWRGSEWFIISERNSLLFTPVSSLIDTRLFTVHTCSFTVSFYISPYYVSLLNTLIRIVLSILS